LLGARGGLRERGEGRGIRGADGAGKGVDGLPRLHVQEHARQPDRLPPVRPKPRRQVCRLHSPALSGARSCKGGRAKARRVGRRAAGQAPRGACLKSDDGEGADAAALALRCRCGVLATC
jgi:hypothetical protein